MRRISSLLSILVLILSCSKDSVTPTPTPEPTPKYALVIAASEGGAVSTSGGTYDKGTKVTVTATPDGEYLFDSWSDGSTENPREITVTSNLDLTANFVKKKYSLSISTSGEGTVTEEVLVQGSVSDYNSGTKVRLTAVPNSDENWEFIGWEGDIESTNPVIEIDVTDAKTLEAKFMRYFDYYNTSYELQKSNIWINYYDILGENGIDYGSIAFGCPEVIADFDGDGYEDWMTAPSYYQQDLGVLPLWFFKNQGDNSTFIKKELEIENHIGTWNARKGILGDFNNDGKPDVAYPEQGVDIAGGEESAPSILISTPDGYTMRKLSDRKVYLHTGASGDIDNDGDLDIIMSSQHILTTFLNNGDGTFIETNVVEKDPSSEQIGFVSMELFDINRDGNLDLIAGGDENNLPSRVYFGNGSNFSYINSKIIPLTEPWRGTLDYDFADIDNNGTIEIIMGRFKNVYEGYFIEIVTLVDDEYITISELVDNSEADNIRWITWLRVQDIDNNGSLDIFSNDRGHLGYGEYRWEWNGNGFTKMN